ncbi:MAG: thioesterase family protein [Myxococcales bacterium]|nr:thioesterase family protein [Myxococcales bacterium]MCB9715663.1 thioesterase family protein [Myxococcales bacterium]
MTELAPIPPERVRILRQWFEQGIPFNRFLGLRLELVERGRCVLRLPWRDELVGDASRPAVHGGVISTLLDTAGGGACFAMLDHIEDRLSTVDLRVDYLRPGPAADLWCTGHVVRVGNRVGVARMAVYAGALPIPGEPDHPVATGNGVYNIVRRSEE